MRKKIVVAGLLLLVPTFLFGDFINPIVKNVLQISGAILCVTGFFIKKEEE